MRQTDPMDDPSPEAAQGMNGRARVIRAVRTAFVVLVVAWLLWTLISNQAIFENLVLLWKIPSAWLFVVGWAMIPVGLWILWRSQILLSTGHKLPWAASLSIQAVAWGGRYLPGKAGLWVAKTAMTRDSGLEWRVLGLSVLTEQVLFLIAGGLVALALLIIPQPSLLAQFSEPFVRSSEALGEQPAGVVIALGAIAIAAVVASPVILARIAGNSLGAVGWQHWPLLLAGHIVIHLIAGLSMYPLIASLLPEVAGALGPLGIAGALALANIAGIVAIFAPAGLGVREAVLALILAVGVNYEQALGVAVMLRVITLFSDVLFTAGGWIAGKFFEP